MPMTLSRTETAVEATLDGRTVARYVVTSRGPGEEAPKPYFHPLTTLAGQDVTGFRPADHRWHHGLALALPNVDDHNLWGGGTFIDAEQGYRVLDDHGDIVHDAWLPDTEPGTDPGTEHDAGAARPPSGAGPMAGTAACSCGWPTD